ncbi:hypothetical protein CDIK_0782 [Cucumispora dikerogammari]|nr:hypothetical protein CDIK_0782 [Cucumispora dikerogammari]
MKTLCFIFNQSTLPIFHILNTSQTSGGDLLEDRIFRRDGLITSDQLIDLNENINIERLKLEDFTLDINKTGNSILFPLFKLENDGEKKLEKFLDFNKVDLKNNTIKGNSACLCDVYIKCSNGSETLKQINTTKNADIYIFKIPSTCTLHLFLFIAFGDIFKFDLKSNGLHSISYKLKISNLRENPEKKNFTFPGTQGSSSREYTLAWPKGFRKNKYIVNPKSQISFDRSHNEYNNMRASMKTTRGKHQIIFSESRCVTGIDKIDEATNVNLLKENISENTPSLIGEAVYAADNQYTLISDSIEPTNIKNTEQYNINVDDKNDSASGEQSSLYEESLSEHESITESQLMLEEQTKIVDYLQSEAQSTCDNHLLCLQEGIRETSRVLEKPPLVEKVVDSKKCSEDLEELLAEKQKIQEKHSTLEEQLKLEEHLFSKKELMESKESLTEKEKSILDKGSKSEKYLTPQGHITIKEQVGSHTQDYSKEKDMQKEQMNKKLQSMSQDQAMPHNIEVSENQSITENIILTNKLSTPNKKLEAKKQLEKKNQITSNDKAVHVDKVTKNDREEKKDRVQKIEQIISNDMVNSGDKILFEDQVDAVYALNSKDKKPTEQKNTTDSQIISGKHEQTNKSTNKQNKVSQKTKQNNSSSSMPHDFLIWIIVVSAILLHVFILFITYFLYTDYTQKNVVVKVI